MSYIDARIALINELARHPALTVDEAGMMPVARSNAFRLRQPMTMHEQIDTAAAFDELGFRLERIKKRIAGGNVQVFNPRKMRVRGPQLAAMRAYG